MVARARFKAALLAFSIVGLSACGGGQTVTPEMFDAEVQRLSDSGDMYGEVFLALKTRRPELYNDFRRIAQREFNNGRSLRDSSRVASMRMRDKFLGEILELSKAASDETVDEVIDVMLDTYTILGEKSAKECARNIDGLPPEKIELLPRELRQRETELVIKLLNAPQTAANRRAASRKEVVNWMQNLAKLEPEVGQMLHILAKEKRGKKDDQALCDGMIATYKRLSYKKSTERGVLFRGLALMALQERLHIRNTTESEDENA
ncbi:MAG: hypothetical protein HRT81_05460 [Henriciella sp.]|nr:hypothetical protein [Henriciella sp.]